MMPITVGLAAHNLILASKKLRSQSLRLTAMSPVSAGISPTNSAVSEVCEIQALIRTCVSSNITQQADDIRVRASPLLLSSRKTPPKQRSDDDEAERVVAWQAAAHYS